MVTDLADVVLNGRAQVAGGAEETCSAVFFAEDRVLVMTEAPFEAGEQAILYLDALGALHGVIDRPRGRGFVLNVSRNEERSVRIAARLAWLAEQRCQPIEQRADPRIVPENRHVVVRFPDGTAVDGAIENLSKSGALVSLPVLVPVGLAVTVGKRHAVVVRVETDAIAVRFRLPFCDGTFHPGVVL